MARTWRTERTTPKQPRKATPRPRKGEFSHQAYADTVTALPLRDCACGQLVQCHCGSQVYVEADA